METRQSLSHEAQLEQANKRTAELADKLTNDRYRLHYHLMPAVGWMNDPNGLVYFQGDYHAFYQHHPFDAKWGPMHWGHAKSADLVHWEHLPIALAPSEPYDSGSNGGCWSGSAVEADGQLVLIYTGHVDGNSPVEVQCAAVSTDGITFEKAAANPVIPGPQEEGFGFRDPKVWKHGDTWFMVVGNGKDGIGRVLLYTSTDLQNWQYAGVTAESDGTMGDMWECPDLFPLGGSDRHVLIFSPMNMGAVKTMYLSGTFEYEAGKLTAAYGEQLDYGFDFYAPQTLMDDRGRRILFGWMNMWGATMPEQEDGWMGAFTIPRELTLVEDGTLRIQPAVELAELRGEYHTLEGQVLEAGTIRSLSEDGIQGEALEIIALFELSEARDEEFGLLLRCSSDGSQYTEVRYSASEGKLFMDRNRAGSGDGGISEMTLEPREDGSLKLHLFLDRTSVELFANDGLKTMTNRIYPDPVSLGIKLFSRAGSPVLQSMKVWELKSIW